MTGRIIKGIGGFYYVDTAEGIFECKGKGVFRNQGLKLAVGDKVKVEEVPLSKEAADRGLKHEGVITEVLPRINEFVRPPIVNVDALLITLACKNPEPNFALIDKFLIMAEMKNVEAVIVVNKCDLVSGEELEAITSIYEKEYRTVPVSAETGDGIEELREVIRDRVAAFGGPSGVGKSSLINLLYPDANMETGNISEKTLRGRHTTRHVEIFKAGEAMIYDTPGFTSFEMPEVSEEQLQLFYPEIERLRSGCYFDNCRHINEPDCAVRQAVREGKLNKKRYLSYKSNYNEILSNQKY